MRKTKNTLERELFQMRAAFTKYRHEFAFMSDYLKERGLEKDYAAYSAECRRKQIKEYNENKQKSFKETPEYKELLDYYGEEKMKDLFTLPFKEGGVHHE